MKIVSHLLVAILVSFVLISSGHTKGKGKLLAQQNQKTRLNNKNENSKLRKTKPSSTNATTLIQRLSAGTGQKVAVDRLKANDAYDEYAKLLFEFSLDNSWEKFLTPVPTSLGILSTLITMTADLTNDFPLNDHAPPIGGFHYMKHADSFHLSLFQISQESYQAFLCAQNNMNRIRLSTLTIPTYIRAALDILDTEDIELIQTRLHLPLTVVQKSINSNMKWSSEVIVAFERLDDLIIEVLLATESLLPIPTSRNEKLVKNMKHGELKSDNIQIFLKNKKEQVEQELAKQSQADKDLLKAHRSVPTNIDRFFMDVGQFFTGSTRELLSKEETGKAFDHLIQQQNGPSNHSTSHDPCIYNNSVPIITIHARSELLLNDYNNLSSIDSKKGKYNASEDTISFRNLSTNNTSIKCQPLEKVIEMGCKTIELIHELAHATIESMPKEARQDLPMTEKDSKATFEKWRNTQFQQTRESMVRFNGNAKLLANILLRGKEVITDQFHGNFTHPVYNIKSNRHSEQSTAYAYYKIAFYTESARVLKENLEATTKQIMETTKESIIILNQIRSWKTEEIGLKRAIEILKLGLEDMNKIKENWILLARFFTKLSEIIETTLRNILFDFVKQLNTMTSTPSLKKKEDMKNLVVIRQIRDKTVRANQVLTLVHEMSSTYYHISRDYLMPRVHRLDFLMNISNGNSSNTDSERNRFIQECENDAITIQRLIYDKKQRLMEKLNATVRQIVDRNRRFLQIN